MTPQGDKVDTWTPLPPIVKSLGGRFKRLGVGDQGIGARGVGLGVQGEEFGDRVTTWTPPPNRGGVGGEGLGARG